MNTDTAQKILDKAKLNMMMRPNTVFYTTLLFSLQHEWDNSIPTAVTNGVYLKINPDWFEKLTHETCIGLLAHEVLHVALDHITRMGERDCIVQDNAGQSHSLWNIAADHVINLSLLRAMYTLPDGGVHDPRFNRMSTEQVYDILFSELKEKPPETGSWGGDIKSPTKEDEQKVKKDITASILRAATMSKMTNEDPGCIPGEVLVQLEKVLNPKLPWNVILINWLTDFAKDDYSMRRPNRKFMPDYYLPSAHSEAIADLVIAVDESGSVSNRQFSYFIAEISSLQRTMLPKKITLIGFDTVVNNIDEITHNTDILAEIEFHGRGGTKLEELFKWVEENRPQIMLIFTDGYVNIPSQSPPTAIIWLIHNNSKFTAPYGEVIHYDI